MDRGRPSWDFRRDIVGVRHLVQAGADHGVAADRMLATTGLRVEDLAVADVEVEGQQELRVVENLLAAVGDRPGLGTEVASRFSLNTFGLLGFAMLSSTTAGEALGVALRTLEIGNRFIRIDAEFTADSVRVHFSVDELPPATRNFLLERDLVLVFGVIVLRCLGARLLSRLPELGLDVALPAAHTEALLAGITTMLSDLAPNPMDLLPVQSVQAGRPGTCLTVPLDVLAEPMSMPDAATAAICEQHCLDLLQRRRERGKLTSRVRALLLRQDGITLTAAELAAQLNVDRRTLHRQLAAEGTSFRSLHEETRRLLAEDMLASLGLTVQETGARLGYSSPAAFSRAFTRWTGRSPREFRRDQA